MDIPLIPNSRKGTIVAILLIVLTFCAYYLWPNFYSKLLLFYRAGMEKPSALSSFGPDGSLKVRVMIPNYTSAAIPRWAYVMVANDSTKEIVNNVQIRIELQDFLTKQPIIHPLLPSLFKFQTDQQTYESAVLFNKIYPLSSVSGRILLVSESKNDLKVNVYGIYDSADGTPIPVRLPINITVHEDLSKTLIYSLIESVLLPPWLNIVIPIFVLLIISLVEGKNTSETLQAGNLPKENPSSNVVQNGTANQATTNVSKSDPNTFLSFIEMLLQATLTLLAIIFYLYLFFSAILHWGTISGIMVFIVPITIFFILFLLIKKFREWLVNKWDKLRDFWKKYIKKT